MSMLRYWEWPKKQTSNCSTVNTEDPLSQKEYVRAHESSSTTGNAQTCFSEKLFSSCPSLELQLHATTEATLSENSIRTDKGFASAATRSLRRETSFRFSKFT